MKEIGFLQPDSPVRLAGILDVRPTHSGAILSRLPAWAQAQIVDPAITWTATVPSGARLEFATDATEVELEVQLLRLVMGDERPRPAGFDLTVDGALVDGRQVDEGHRLVYRPPALQDAELIRGGPSTIGFYGLAPGLKQVQLWLPNNASLQLCSLRVSDDATVSPPARAGRRWVHYGSSISHAMEAERPTGVWPVVAARRAGADLTSLGLAGQAQLDQFAARTIRDLPVDLISLKVGINLVNGDSMRERTFVPAVHGFLDTVRDGHPDAPLLLISPIICPTVEDHPGPTLTDASGFVRVVPRGPELATGALTLSRIRALLETVVTSRRQGGDSQLFYLDGRQLFGVEDIADLPDGLHPNSAGYQRMGQRFADLAFAADGPFGG